MFPRHGTEAFDMVTQCVLFVMLEAAKKATHSCAWVCGGLQAEAGSTGSSADRVGDAKQQHRRQ